MPFGQAAVLILHVSAICHRQGSASHLNVAKLGIPRPELFCVNTEFSFPSSPVTDLCGDGWCTFTGLESDQPSVLHTQFLDTLTV